MLLMRIRNWEVVASYRSVAAVEILRSTASCLVKTDVVLAVQFFEIWIVFWDKFRWLVFDLPPGVCLSTYLTHDLMF